MAISLGFWILVLGSLIGAASGSIHEYKNEGFTKRGDALYCNGGSEGVYASEFPSVRASSAAADSPPLKGKSFIRFDGITFVRSMNAAIKQNSTQAFAILFEAMQEDRIGGSCCTQALADAGSCNLGEVVISADPNDPEEPKRIPTFFKSSELEAKMSLEAVAINRTGWYTVYFMTCDPELESTVIRGRTVWKNPDGYLPRGKAPLKNKD